MNANSAPSLRILQVAAPARTGGLEAVVVQLSAALREHGHDVQVAAVLTPGSEHNHPFLEALRERNVPLHVLLIDGRQYLREWAAIRELGRALHVDVVHTHGYRADILHGSSTRAAGARHVMTLHGFVSGSWRDRLYESLQLRAARRAHSVVAVSEPIVRRLAAAGVRNNVHLLRNAVGSVHNPHSRFAARAELGLPLQQPLVGWVGRVSDEKGPDLFVEALALASEGIHGVIVGDGPLREKVTALAASLGVSHRLHWIGLVPQASRYFNAFDVVAMTSRTEGTPMVMLEAMACSVPVVTTMVGGIPDIVDNTLAWCCAPADTRALAVAFSDAARDSESRTGRILSAQSLVQREFGLMPWLAAHERIYRGAEFSSSAR